MARILSRMQNHPATMKSCQAREETEGFRDNPKQSVVLAHNINIHHGAIHKSAIEEGMAK
jgi:hypothetical protein